MARRALRQTRPLAFAAAACLLALLALASLAFEREGEGEAALPETGWSVEVAEGYEYADFVIAISDRPAPGFEGHHGTGGRIVLLHPRSGERMATIRTSYAPMAVRRASTKQLLVSDIAWVAEEDGDLRGHARLLVFDLSNGVELVRVTPMPSRASYKFYWPGIVGLSGDERYFFYMRQVYEGDSYQGNQWMALDLDDRASEPAQATELARCGIAIVPGPGDSALVVCGDVLRMSGAHGVLERAPAAGHAPFHTADGMLGTVSQYGSAKGTQRTGETQETSIFPPHSESMLSWAAWPDGRLVMGYRTLNTFVNHLDGFVVFDPESFSVLHSGVEALSVAPVLDGTSVWYLRDDGTIASFGWGRRDATRPLGNQPLFPPRVGGSEDYEWQHWALIP